MDEGLLRELADRKVPVILVFNKADLYTLAGEAVKKAGELGVTHLHVSSTTGENIEDARKAIARIGSGITVERDTILGDIINHGDIVCLVVPIDLGAPRAGSSCRRFRSFGTSSTTTPSRSPSRSGRSSTC